MFYKKVVQEVLRRCLTNDRRSGRSSDKPVVVQDSEISMLIHDVFGGEILKTHEENGWHFYNMIDGERIDFTLSDTEKSADDIKFEDIPTTSAETSGYFDVTDYSTFFMRFVKAFEETVGLGGFRQGAPA
jgi:hypothetical protein